MRILYFTSRECWPANTGARLRDYHLARQLARHADLVYFGLCPDGSRPAAEAPGIPRMIVAPKDPSYSPMKLLRGVVGPVPVTLLNCQSARIEHALTALLREQEFDTVQLEGVHLLPYVKHLRSARKAPRILCDWHNIESEIMWRFRDYTPHPAKRWYAARTARLIENMEGQLLSACDAHVFVSDRDRAQLAARGCGKPLHVIDNGVDVPYYAPGSPRLERKHLLYVGSMDYHANIDAVQHFATDIWPAIHARNPDRQFLIVGARPAPAVQALAARPGIVVTGTVEDVRPYYAQAAVSVVPLRIAGGSRLKILESMAAGVPVVSTPIGAEGLAVQDQQDILLSESSMMAQTIQALLPDEERQRTLACAGRRLVSSRYDWPVLGKALFDIHRSLLA